MPQKCTLLSKGPSQGTQSSKYSLQNYIFADYFKLEGKNFLIIGDRLSGWTEVFCNAGEDSSAGSKGLCKGLRHVFSTFGVPDDLSSDGGLEFIA